MSVKSLSMSEATSGDLEVENIDDGTTFGRSWPQTVGNGMDNYKNEIMRQFGITLDYLSENAELLKNLNINPEPESEMVSESGHDMISESELKDPVGSICFIRDTPIKTDQGEIKIQEINTNIHTINSKKIIAITKTKLDGKLLIRVEKNAFGEDCPNHSVVMSGNHKILYNGNLLMAKELALNMPGKLNYIKYKGDPLYNILMKKHDTMIVNNMVVETLHPDNKIAILYKSLLKECNTNNINDFKKLYYNLCDNLNIQVR